MASADESNAFTYVETPAAWWPWHAAPPIQVKELGPGWTLPDADPEAWVCPCYRRLAMGFTHSVALLCLVNGRVVDHLLEITKSFVRLVRLNDDVAWAEGCHLTRKQGALYIHVDDFG
eukprot:11280215-Alexandrium_andersonii.AAC.1